MALTKVLWMVSMDAAAEARLLHNAQHAGVQTVCIRSATSRLPDAIGRFHQQGFKVYAWRWPAVDDTAHDHHHFALDEADFVAQELIPAGLDGYIVDPESDDGRDIDDWNDPDLAPLAQDFCATIKDAAGPGFHFGITSGCTYPRTRPDIPWNVFVRASNAVYPQTYWRALLDGHVKDINGGSPDKAIDRGVHDWQPIAAGKPIVPMTGELPLVTAAEIRAYGARLVRNGVTEAHFYADEGNVPAANFAAIAALTDAIA